MRKLTYLIFTGCCVFCIVSGGCAPMQIDPHTYDPPPVTPEYHIGPLGSEGHTYNGLLLNGVPHGYGIYIWPDGNIYEGEFRYGMKNGQGTLLYQKGDQYVGQWLDDNRHGQGTITYTSGDQYVGQWLDSKRHGRGTIITPDGEMFDGEWREDKPHGIHMETSDLGTELKSEYVDGKFIKSSGTWVRREDRAKFVGEFWDIGEFWDSGKFGKGKIIYEDGRKYDGEWSDGGLKINEAPHGQGTMMWPDGRRYEGAWKKGKMHGFGIMIYPDGLKRSTIWRENAPVAWTWREGREWPKLGDSDIGNEDQAKWIEVLRRLWSGRKKENPDALFYGLLLRELLEETNRVSIEKELRSFIWELRQHKVHMAFGEFTKVSEIEPSIAVEIQEDTVRAIRETSRKFFRVTDWEQLELAQKQLERVKGETIRHIPVDYLVMVKLAGIQLDEQRKVAGSTGKLQIDKKVYPNPVYYDLVRARTASEGMLARIQRGGVEAHASADKQETKAMLPVMFGGLAGGNMDRATSAATLLGALSGLSDAHTERERASEYEARYKEAQGVVDQLSRQIGAVSETIEEPVYYEFHHEDQYVVKKAVATAFLKVIDPNALESIVFDRKIVSDISKADTYKEADETINREGDPLELPSDFQMKREVTQGLTSELVKQLKEGFLDRVGLEYYALVAAAEKTGDAEKFAENAIEFLLSPASVTYSEQAKDTLLLFEDLIRRATQSEREIGLSELLGK